MINTEFGGYIYRIPPDIIQTLSQQALLPSFMLTRLGYFVQADQHFAARTTIGEFIIMYCLDGRGWLNMAGECWPVKPGDLAVVLRDNPHSYGAAEDDPWTIYWAHFNGDQAWAYLKLAGFAPNTPVIGLPAQNSLPFMFTEIATILQTGYSCHHLAWASDCLRQILSYVAFQNSIVRVQADSRLDVRASINLMRERLRSTCTVEMLAEQACLSTSYFSRLFRQATGYPPIEYYLRLKMQKACELLELTPLPVQEVSEYLGYTNPFYFSRLFKKIVGMAPSRYRQSPC